MLVSFGGVPKGDDNKTLRAYMGGPPKWMVKIMVPNPIKMHDLGGKNTPIFGNIHVVKFIGNLSINVHCWAKLSNPTPSKTGWWKDNGGSFTLQLPWKGFLWFKFSEDELYTNVFMFPAHGLVVCVLKQ